MDLNYPVVIHEKQKPTTLTTTADKILKQMAGSSSMFPKTRALWLDFGSKDQRQSRAGEYARWVQN